MIYLASPKHCEPITAERPGTKCPDWSRDQAQSLLNASEQMRNCRVNTMNGIAFVARDTNDGTWHGYPEAWEKIDRCIVDRWIEQGRVTRREIKRMSKLRDGTRR